MKILIVEDEVKVRNFLKKSLKEKQVHVDTASNVAELMKQIQTETYDALILDRLLAGVDSLSLIPEIREKFPETKILVLSALSEVDEKVQGLSHGADDYLEKPFHISELMARLQAVCRRRNDQKKSEPVLKLKDLSIDLETQKVERNGSRLDLTAKEYKLLVFLVKNPNRIFSRIDLLSDVWELKHDPGSNIVEVVINHLRSKIDKGFNEPLLHSKRGVGYWIGDVSTGENEQ